MTSRNSTIELKKITNRMAELGIETLGLLNGAMLRIDGSNVYYSNDAGEITFKRKLAELGGAA